MKTTMMMPSRIIDENVAGVDADEDRDYVVRNNNDLSS